MSTTPAADENPRPLPDGYRPLPGSERRPTRGARRVEAADPDEVLTVSVYVRRRPGAPPLTGQEYWRTTPPGHRQFLTREEMAAVHGAAQADLDTVIQFGESHGLTVAETSVARRLVALSGTVGQMNEAFAVDLGRYEAPAAGYRGREGPVYLPGGLADVVVGVFGLDNRPMARRASNGGPPGASPLTPPQVAQLYNFPTGTAAGQTIGILELGGGYNLTDIDAFFSGLLLTTPNINAVSVDGVTNSPTGDPYGADGEVVMDIDVAGSVGMGANIAVYFAPLTDQGWADAITKAVLEPAGLPAGWATPSVLSCSWGWTELEADAPTSDTADPWPFEWTQQAITLVSGTYQQAAMMGVTVFNCSFDDGSNQYQDDGNAHVAYPCSDIWVTACGGTLITNVSGSSFTESTWNDDAYQTGAATGGGISDAIGLPAWQQGIVPPSVNPGGRVGRGLPDVAGNASYYSGYVFQVDGQSGFQENGTSSVAPLYAGLIALINAKLGQPVGYLNPTLYALAQDPAYAGVIRDIDDGISNAVHWIDANGNTQGPSLGYTSGPGWDACTGLGVLDGASLLGALQDLYAKAVTLSLERDHFGQDEIDGIRAQTG